MNPNRAQAGYWARVAAERKAKKASDLAAMDRARREAAEGMQKNGLGRFVLAADRKKD